MSEELVVRQCAPTLAGIKTGSLFSCPCDSPEELRQEVRRINRLLAGKGLCLLPLRFDGSRALLYLYRPSRLRQDLEDAEAMRLLEEYNVATVPAIGLGDACGDFIRISYAASDENIVRGLENIEAFVKSLGV